MFHRKLTFQQEMERVKAELMASECGKSKAEECAKRSVEGQLKKHFAEAVLMNQAYILDDSKTEATLRNVRN